MNKAITILLAMLVAGCATTAHYFPYTSQKFPPKPKDYFISIYPQGQANPVMSRPYVVIGKVNISGKVSEGVTAAILEQKAKSIARKKGADAVINAKTEKLSFNGIHTVPAEVEYRPIVIAGRHNRGTVYMEDYRPAQYVPYTDILFTFNGELIIFKN